MEWTEHTLTCNWMSRGSSSRVNLWYLVTMWVVRSESGALLQSGSSSGRVVSVHRLFQPHHFSFSSTGTLAALLELLDASTATVNS